MSAQKDKELIHKLGGITVVAQMCGFDSLNGVRRVSNWTRRGIPAAIKLKYKFLRNK
ncbi:hypothetical protein [Snodgrassella sp. ESL0324]|uniref:hypothetical protein n=1 Tax=Snodgrassella sp. ESL0324 TaxID=2705033 RepID=UPI0015842F1F|nr:hypothetical protein [Snodgrassella sp. ESL0324]